MKQLLCFLLLCSTLPAVAQPGTSARRGQPTLIYKTRKDYRNLVPVLLSDDRTTIVSYPAPKDVYYQGKLALPVRLQQGYLLDNRGIGLNVGFLKTTYQAYAKLAQAPSLTVLYSQLIDKDPLTVLIDCGNRTDFKSVVADLNAAIRSKRLSTYRRVK